METHISIVFLAGDRVFKLKRAVKYPYLDFSTLEQRRQFCQAEVAINRRTAPSIYKGVVPVTYCEADGFTIGGQGDVVEWLVEMARFDEETLFDRLGAADKLPRQLLGNLAAIIASFHMSAEVCPQADFRKELEKTITGNAASFAEFGNGIFDLNSIETLGVAQRAALQGETGERIDSRRKAGLVRRCHGDLHLGNVCLIDGAPVLFDAIEFNDTFSQIDVVYDLAFLLMDLDFIGRRRLANIVLNRYLDITDDTEGLAFLPLYLSLRAAIRAHVGATAACKHSDALEQDRLACDARRYLELAQDYLKPGRPMLVAVGGLSGSGKSRMGRELASFIGAAPGARIARSDVLRKRLAGIDPLSRLSADGYSPDMTRRTYEAVYDETRRALAQGHSVVADAVFAKPEERRAIADIAREMNVPFNSLWLEAPEAVMEARVTLRKNNPSDADATVVRLQQSYDLGNIDWTRIDSSGPKPITLEKGLKTLGLSVVTDRVKGA
ncbi:MAG: AAA family ATPase [Rhodospirillales bacterium]|nr:AAA family ATPase [Rhodospirillales bacterium]